MILKVSSIYIVAAGLALGACSRSPDGVPEAPTVATPEVMTQPWKIEGSGDAAKVKSKDRTIEKALENGEIKETPLKAVDPRWVTPDQDNGAKAPEGQKIDPKTLPAQDLHSNPFPQLKIRTEPDPGKPIPEIGASAQPAAGGVDFKIEILNKELLVAIDTKELLVLYNNALSTQKRAMDDLFEQGRGVYCQTEGAATLQPKDVLKLVDGGIKDHPEDKTIKISTFKFQSASAKAFALVCTSRGSVSEFEFQENFKTIISFGNPATAPGAGNSGSGNSRHDESPEEAIANDKKRKSFKILDLETLAATIVKEGSEQEAKVIMDGKLVPVEQAQALVYEGKSEQSCQVARVIGELQKDKIYRHTDTGIVAKDGQRKVALISYQYDIDEKNNLTLFCFVRLSTHVNEIFYTLKGVVEFGAEK